MLQKLLAERFQLTSHRERREMPVYVLTLAKGGSKLTAADAAEAHGSGCYLKPWGSARFGGTIRPSILRELAAIRGAGQAGRFR